jgi:hypothetical protein
MPLAPGTIVQLFLNGKNVGSAVVHRHDHGWHFGDFTPAPAFSEFAPLYGQWSLLMHADDDRDLLSPAASEELRRTEIAMDRIQARIFVPAVDQWHTAVEINIDGPLIEWREA